MESGKWKWKSGKVEKWKIGKWAADLWDGTFNETTGRIGMDSRQARKDGHGLVWSGLVWYGWCPEERKCGAMYRRVIHRLRSHGIIESSNHRTLGNLTEQTSPIIRFRSRGSL